MQQVMIFEGHEVEVFEWNGQVLFNPYHVGTCLDIENVTVRRHIQNMNEKQVILLKNLDVQDMNIRKLNNAGENFLTELGVYKLIFKSREEEAERFQDWVTDEVLPSIRQTGSYTKEVNQCNIKEIVKETIYQVVPEIIRELEDKEERNKRAEREMKKLEAKVKRRIERLLYSEKYSYYEISKLLGQEGIDTSAEAICFYAQNIGL